MWSKTFLKWLNCSRQLIWQLCALGRIVKVAHWKILLSIMESRFSLTKWNIIVQSRYRAVQLLGLQILKLRKSKTISVDVADFKVHRVSLKTEKEENSFQFITIQPVWCNIIGLANFSTKLIQYFSILLIPLKSYAPENRLDLQNILFQKIYLYILHHLTWVEHVL